MGLTRPMHIAVIVPAFNVAPWIGDALASVRAQTHRDWSLVLVDDGSVDATVDAATGFADPRIRLLRQVNAGVAVARNRGLTASASDAILFLDADDWLAPEALARLAGALGQAPAAVAAAARFAFVSEGAAPDPGFQPGSGSRWSGLSGTRAPASGDILPRLLERNLFANGGHLLIRRAALERGGVPPGLGLRRRLGTLVSPRAARAVRRSARFDAGLVCPPARGRCHASDGACGRLIPPMHGRHLRQS